MLTSFFRSINATNDANPIVKNRRDVALIIASIVSMIATLVDIFQNYEHGFFSLAYIEVILLVIYSVNYFLYRATNVLQRHAFIYAFTFTFHIVVSFFIDGYGVDIMLFLLAVLPIVLFLLLNTKEAIKVLYFICFILVILTLNSYYKWLEPLFNFDIFSQLVLIFPFYVILVYMVEKSRTEAEAKVLSQDREKAVLLKEVHHRVKNNMQVIMSLLWLQSEKVEDPKYSKLFLENIDRLSAMALVHESIYKAENFENINMKDYLERILGNLSRVSVHEIKCDLEPLSLDMKSAMNLGLIVNEIVTNAFEHAYEKGHQGIISVYLHENDDEITLKVQDFGQGIKSDVDLSKSLGFTLIYDLSSSLEESHVKIKNNDGVEILINFKKGEKRAS